MTAHRATPDEITAAKTLVGMHSWTGCREVVQTRDPMKPEDALELAAAVNLLMGPVPPLPGIRTTADNRPFAHVGPARCRFENGAPVKPEGGLQDITVHGSGGLTAYKFTQATGARVHFLEAATDRLHHRAAQTAAAQSGMAI